MTVACEECTVETFISVEEAREAILSRVHRLASQRVLLSDALHRRLAETISAPEDSPAFDNSAMDGFAFRYAECRHELEVVGESAAGKPFEGEMSSGQAVRIMTGAAVPAGADSVAMREVCEVTGDTLRINEEVQVGEHIRKRGSYAARGEAVLSPGDLLGPAEIGLLASFARTVVYVTRRARVAIVTTGSELVEPDRLPGEGQIVNSNAFMLEALCHTVGALPVVVPIVEDTESATRTALEAASEAADLVVTVGGVSVGDYDFVRGVLDDMAGGMQFWKVRMKPGKPLAFGMIDGRRPVIGLPGNPVSSFVGFHQFVRPAVAVLQGTPRTQADLRRVELPTANDIRSTPKRRQFVLGAIDARPEGAQFVSQPDQSSGNLLAMRGCGALGIVDEGISFVPAGTPLLVEYL